MRATDLMTGRTRALSRFEALNAQAVSVSPDGKTVLLTAYLGGYDLMLVEN